MSDAVEEAVDLAVAERGSVLVGLQLRCKREVAELPSHRGQQLFHRSARSRARVADVEALAFEIGKRLGADLLAPDDGERLGMHREDRTQVAEGAFLAELALALR